MGIDKLDKNSPQSGGNNYCCYFLPVNCCCCFCPGHLLLPLFCCWVVVAAFAIASWLLLFLLLAAGSGGNNFWLLFFHWSIVVAVFVPVVCCCCCSCHWVTVSDFAIASWLLLLLLPAQAIKLLLLSPTNWLPLLFCPHIVSGTGWPVHGQYAHTKYAWFANDLHTTLNLN